MFLSVVIPCYNEDEVLNHTISKLSLYLKTVKLEKIIENYEIILVDDGSKDKTWELINSLKANIPQIRGIKLAKNSGHQNALLAGLYNSMGDATISMDADLQDDIGIIKEMIIQYTNGNEIIYGVRKSRSSDTFLKRFSAESFYKLISLMGVEIVFNHADFRLMSRRAIEILKEFKEINLFLRGLVPLIGLKTANVYYDRAERFAGTSKYPLGKMLKFAWEGITSFSVAPLRVISAIGFFIFFISLAISFWVLYIKTFTNNAIPGWASTALPIYFIGGVQLLSLGIIGEYIGKIYYEVKHRPRYIIEETI